MRPEKPGANCTSNTGETPCFLPIEIPSKLEDAKRKIILETLLYYKDNRRKTAKALKIGIRTLQRYLKSWGVERSETRK